MSNFICVIATTFTDVLGVSHGYRAYDDYACTYNNMFESPLPEDDLEMLEYILTQSQPSDTFIAMIQHVYESQKSIFINQEVYSFDQIKYLLDRFFSN